MVRASPPQRSNGGASASVRLEARDVRVRRASNSAVMRRALPLVVAALALGAGISCKRHRAQSITRGPVDAGAASTTTVPRYSKFEVRFDVPGRTLEPDDVHIRAVFTEPSGTKITIGGFAVDTGFAVRFSPRVVGVHRYEIHADGGAGERLIQSGAFTAVAGGGHGFVRHDPKDAHRLVRDDGAPFFVLGENRINVYDPTWNYQSMAIEPYLAQMAEYGMTTVRVFIFSDAHSETTADGRQPGCLEPKVGRFDLAVAKDFDRIFDAAEAHDLEVVIVPWAIGFTPGTETWKSWNDNPYCAAQGGPAKTVEDFFTDESIRKTASKKLRYVLDRWGWSPHLLAVDLINEPEWDGPPLPETTWIPWAEKMAADMRAYDPYRHLVTAGPVGLKWNVGSGDEKPWYSSASCDLVQWHLYGKEYYDPWDLATEMTRRIDETWSFGKPVFCGEFAYGGEDKTTYDHTHVGIWSALMSGAGALAHSAPQFQIDSDEPMTPDRARHFLTLSKFLRSLDWKRDLAPAHDATATPTGTRVWTLRSKTGDARALWVLGPHAGYGKKVANARVTVPDLPPGKYQLDWWDDVTGSILGPPVTVESTGAPTTIDVPPFTRHIAARLSPASL